MSVAGGQTSLRPHICQDRWRIQHCIENGRSGFYIEQGQTEYNTGFVKTKVGTNDSGEEGPQLCFYEIKDLEP